jgi:exonuclease VII large subunit
MSAKLLIYLTLIPALSFSTAFAIGEVGSGQNVGHDDSAVLADQGNAQLTGTPDAARGSISVKQGDGKEDTEKIEERQEKEYWCKRVAYHRKRIENAQYEVDKEAELLSELRDEFSMETGRDKNFIEKKINKTRDKLASAQKLLKDRESDLTRLEDEARRKKIPSGWLQCTPVM